MKNKVYSFARSYDPVTVQEAMRILLSAGISREQIRVLEPTEASKRNSLNTPDTKRFALVGALLGAIGGLIMGGIIFVAPKFIWDYAYENELAVVGTIIFLGVGIGGGILHSLILLRRKSGEHLIGPYEHGVFVTVREDQEAQLSRAKDEFNRFDFANA